MKKIILVIIILTSILSLGCSNDGVTSGAISEIEITSKSLTKADPQYISMINNELFNKKQIPVNVNGKIYYGCCEMCEETLRNKPESRIAIDPVSGNEVDKATAIIGSDAEGKAYYFENENNFNKYQS